MSTISGRVYGAATATAAIVTAVTAPLLPVNERGPQLLLTEPVSNCHNINTASAQTRLPSRSGAGRAERHHAAVGLYIQMLTSHTTCIVVFSPHCMSIDDFVELLPETKNET